MFEYIKNANLSPARPQRKRSKTDLIVLHQVEGSMSPQQIHSYHISKGYSGGIAYNIYIGLDGAAYWGRGLEFEDGGVKNSGVSAGVNQRCVAIVCNGNFNKERMGAAQLYTLKRVVLDVAKYYGLTAEQVKGHREVGDSDCPGRYFPLDEVREHVRNNLTGGSNMYVTTKRTAIYKKPDNRDSIGAGNELELLAYPPVQYALVRNPRTGSEFFVEWDSLEMK